MRLILLAATVAFMLVGCGEAVPSTSSTSPSAPATAPTATAKVVAPAAPAGPIFTLTGSGSKSTEDFTVPSLWHFDWTYDCNAFGYQGNFAVIFTGNGGFPNPVNQLGMTGAGTETYHSGGTFHAEVNSECNWTITVRK